MNIKVLCVDDEKDILALCKKLLEISGFLVTTVDNALDALLLLNSEDFGVVITDIKMPIMDGIELSRKIKKLKLCSKVIGLTGYEINLEGQELKDVGMECILKKPLDRIRITEILNKLFSKEGNSNE